MPPSACKKIAEAGDWLKALETAASGHESRRDSARLLIFSRIDGGVMKVGNAKIERFIFFNDTATTEIYTLSLHDALPICLPFSSFSPQARMRGRRRFTLVP